MGGKIKPIYPERFAYEITYKKKKFILISKFAIKSSLLTSPLLAKYKDLTAKMLRIAKIKTPNYVIVKRKNSPNEIKSMLKKVKLPLVIKDAQGSESRGVFTGIETYKEAFDIIKKNIKKYSRLIVQETAKGKEFRILVLDGKIIGALEMVPPFVIGDGISTTLQLIRKKQKKIQKTPLNRQLDDLLKKQGESLKSIPRADKKVFIRTNSCLAEGGLIIDRTDEATKQLSKICKRAAEAVGLKLAGIDLFAKSIKSAHKSYKIIEINGKPDIWIHHHPNIGQPRNVTKEIIEYIVKNNL